MFQQSCRYCNSVIYFEEKDIKKVKEDTGGVCLEVYLGIRCNTCDTINEIKENN